MKHILVPLLFAAIVGVSATFAQTQAAPQVAPEQELRDPFWPIGETAGATRIQPPPAQTNTTVATPPTGPEWPKPIVKAVTKKGSVVWVVVEGSGTFCTGETIPVRSGNRVYRWRIDGIDDKGVRMSKVDVQIHGGK